MQKQDNPPTQEGMAEGVKQSGKFFIYLAHNESMPDGDKGKGRKIVQGPDFMELEPVSTWAERNNYAWKDEGGRICYNIYSTLWRAWCLFEVRMHAPGPCRRHKRSCGIFFLLMAN